MSIGISTRNFNGALRGPIERLQSRQIKAQAELSGGRLSDVGQTLGEGASVSIGLRSQMAALQSYVGCNVSVASRLDATQNALNSLLSVGASLQQTLLNAGDGAAGASSLLARSRAAFDQIIATGNASFAGQFLFAGAQTDTKPLSDYYSSPESAARAAVDDAFSSTFGVSPGSAASASISGDAMQSFLDNQFASLFTSANWKAKWSHASDDVIQSRIGPTTTIASSISANEESVRVLTEAATMVSDLRLDALGGDARAAVLKTATGLIGDALGGLTTLSSRVGAAQQQIDATSGVLKTQSGYLQTRLDDMESVDPAEASTRLTMLSTNLQIAYDMTARLGRLSLVKFL
jgi:flagellar hook-associated protein 3 FlgL